MPSPTYPLNAVRICKLSELPDPGARQLRISDDADALEIFAVRSGDTIRAYVNRCPHTGAPLNWMPDRFLDESGERIICALHAALFRIDDGSCVSGPCAGAGLSALTVELRDDEVYVTLP